MDVEVNRIVEELKQKVVGYTPEDIEQFFDNLKVSIDEYSWIEILDKLAEDTNIFRWFSLICKNFQASQKQIDRLLILYQKLFKE